MPKKHKAASTCQQMYSIVVVAMRCKQTRCPDVDFCRPTGARSSC